MSLSGEAFAAVLPNTSVEAEKLGIAPQLVGAMMAAVPFTTVLAAISLPYFRSRVATIKPAMILITLGQGTCHLLAMRVTRGHRRATVDLTVRMQCLSAENVSTSPLSVCLDNPLNRGRLRDCGSGHPANQCLVDDHRFLDCGGSYCVAVYKEVHLAILCDEESTPPCRMRCHEQRLRRGRRTVAPNNWSDVLRSLRKAVVWSYLLLRLLAIVLCGVAVTLTDALAHLVLDTDEPPPPLLRVASTDPNRLWGSAGWGAASLVAGHLNYWKSPEGGAFINFAPAVYLSAGLNAVDVVAILLLRMPLREAPCRRLFESEPSAFRKWRTYFYMALAYVVGSLSGAIWVFGPLRLRLLGGVPQLLAATSAVQVRELALALTSGPTFELAIGDSPQGKERHLQQVLSTIYHGLGACFGAFVAGCLIPVMEIDRTFVLFGVVALVAFYVQFSVSHLCSKRDSDDVFSDRGLNVTVVVVDVRNLRLYYIYLSVLVEVLYGLLLAVVAYYTLRTVLEVVLVLCGFTATGPAEGTPAATLEGLLAPLPFGIGQGVITLLTNAVANGIHPGVTGGLLLLLAWVYHAIFS
ncbi:hypothetical protein HPB52_000520 [Rhipicephalus sanguineus]|uniref:Uncharacterized protein n=1 Tax=Rhipicephalus sanguineus TaxID=34632 RepID=A0A9D4Q441_RHISA|nr:hypothetical protein HPB52_000520 [Rhipicephalus sanguineus]